MAVWGGGVLLATSVAMSATKAVVRVHKKRNGRACEQCRAAGTCECEVCWGAGALTWLPMHERAFDARALCPACKGAGATACLRCSGDKYLLGS